MRVVDVDEALRRVHAGGVAKSAGLYFDLDCPVPGYLTGVLDRLIWDGLVSVGQGDLLWEMRRLSLTEAGQARYAQSCESQRAAAPVAPPPEHGRSNPGPGPSMVCADPGRSSVEPHAVCECRVRPEAPGDRSALGQVRGSGVCVSGPEDQP